MNSRYISPCGQVFNEPGILRLLEEIESKNQDGNTVGDDGAEAEGMSRLVCAAAEGAVEGRLRDVQLLATGAAVLLVGLTDGLALFLQILLGH